MAILIGIMSGYVILLLQTDTPFPSPYEVISIGLLALVSFIDDRSHVSPALRLLVQGLLAVILVQGLGVYGLLGYVFSIVFMIWSINLYNFMDGMDGFAGGMAVLGFSCMAIVAWDGGSFAAASMCLMVASASLAFLLFNFPPAKIFMGDLGSTLLGAIMGYAILWFHMHDLLKIWLGLLVFSPFFVDASLTLLRRLVRRERIWQAHRSHYYQRLVLSGIGHRNTVLFEYALMAAVGVTAICIRYSSLGLQLTAVFLWLVIYMILMALVAKLETRSSEESLR